MQTINLNILSGAIPPVAHCSQGDVGRQIDFAITDDGEDYLIPTGAVVWVEGTKADRHGFAYDSTNQPEMVSYSDNVVTVKTSEQMTACAGKATCEIKIVSGSAILYTLNFILDVEESALPSDTNMSESDIPMVKKAIEAGEKLTDVDDKITKAEGLFEQIDKDAESASASAKSAKASADTATKKASEAATQAGVASSKATAASESATAADKSATLAESWAVGGTGTRDGEDTDNSKYYAEQSKTQATKSESSADASADSAKASATSANSAADSATAAAKSAKEAAEAVTGVATFNGRAGAVVPASGDYTADQVGAVTKLQPLATTISSSSSTLPKNALVIIWRSRVLTGWVNDFAIIAMASRHQGSGIVCVSAHNEAATYTESTHKYDLVYLTNQGSFRNRGCYLYLDTTNKQYCIGVRMDDAETLYASAIYTSNTTTLIKEVYDLDKDEFDTDRYKLKMSARLAPAKEATTALAGLMSAADKTKLDAIAEGANKYTLPTATSSVIGGVKIGSNITNSSGTISITKANVTSALGYTPPTTNTTYSAATTSAAGLMSAADKAEFDARPKSRKLAAQKLTASGGTLTFTDDAIGDDSMIDVYASIANIAPTSITQSGTTCTVSFDAQSSDFSVALIVYN